ncbi:hypothetical protein Misp02_23010 [Microtetraspora sp. NBRC 16547]|nr:hypothetical protein Misp02_23010 [Microtetraspora sp. NBRC 16547]
MTRQSRRLDPLKEPGEPHFAYAQGYGIDPQVRSRWTRRAKGATARDRTSVASPRPLRRPLS